MKVLMHLHKIAKQKNFSCDIEDKEILYLQWVRFKIKSKYLTPLLASSTHNAVTAINVVKSIIPKVNFRLCKRHEKTIWNGQLQNINNLQLL